ncbi:DcrB-related protein [Solirubrobacter sp. CPCC 204708]|uniref:DUF1795 domain-containing protein n=1 Tax=Solirubrobacter deserti TaxID=2282478 RepID=A0ABT4RGC8_9ACTN|nr:DcrB-related protein [Solirubrobacter deserti]MBE2319682.1 DcrB-related protein [Solirubrobacter deserti]MDA0137579.1 DUF1795 domain-containing protein [Solirubrobacter deserti]
MQRHEHAEFAIDLPEDVELVDQPGTFLVARDGSGASPFRANLTVVAEQLPEPITLDEYTALGVELLERRVPGFRLIDRAATTLAGHAAERTLATYLVDLERPVSVTLEQWRLLVDGAAWIVSCSCDTAEYWQAAEAWTACAESLEVAR